MTHADLAAPSGWAVRPVRVKTANWNDPVERMNYVVQWVAAKRYVVLDEDLGDGWTRVSLLGKEIK